MPEPIMAFSDTEDRADLTAVVLADCCSPRGDYAYVRVNGRWHQAAWVAAAQEGRKITWKGMANPAVACQACGHCFGEATPTRRYHDGAFSPLDGIVRALSEQKAKE